jgi:hypothetical protein
MREEYLGDSVYAEYANGVLQIFLNNGQGRFSDIVLEPEVFVALVEFVRIYCPPNFFEK